MIISTQPRKHTQEAPMFLQPEVCGVVEEVSRKRCYEFRILAIEGILFFISCINNVKLYAISLSLNFSLDTP